MATTDDWGGGCRLGVVGILRGEPQMGWAWLDYYPGGRDRVMGCDSNSDFGLWFNLLHIPLVHHLWARVFMGMDWSWYRKIPPNPSFTNFMIMTPRVVHRTLNLDNLQGFGKIGIS